jgi:hypothetical protein
LDAAGQGAQAGRGGGGLGVPVGVVAQPPAGGDQLGGGHVPQATAEGFWGGGDQRVELSLGVAGGLDRGAAGRQPDLERCSVPCGTRLSELVAAQGLAGGSGGVQRVGLGAVAAGCSLGPVQLNDLLMVSMQEPGQPAP